MTNGTDAFLAFDPALAGGAAVAGSGVVANDGGSYYSKPTDLKNQSDASYIVTTTGASLGGKMTVEVSNANPEDARLGRDVWVTYSAWSEATVSGATSFGIELKRVPFRRMRLRFVQTASTGTLSAHVVVKA